MTNRMVEREGDRPDTGEATRFGRFRRTGERRTGTNPELVVALERLIVAGVAITTRALAEATPGMDLTFPQWRTLLVVGEQPDGATVSEVAARVGVTLPATSRQLRRLADRGLVEIRPDEHDHRAARARLSTRGNGVRDAILRFRREQIVTTAAGLGISATALDALTRVADAFDVHR